MNENEKIKTQKEGNASPPAARMIIGGAIFIIGFLSPLSLPLVLAANFPQGMTAILSGLLVFGIPELAMLIAVAILGKPGFDYLKSRFYALFKKVAPPDAVGTVRYTIGLIMFLMPLFVAFISPYMRYFQLIDLESLPIIFVAGDLLLISSLFVLGGDFWDKIRGLFIRTAKISLE